MYIPKVYKGDFQDLVDSQGRRYTIYDPWSTDTNTWARQPFVGNQIPSQRLSPLAKYLFSITPMPTLPYNPMLDSNWQGPAPGWRRDWTISARIDHRFTEKDQFYARYTLRVGWEATECSARGAPAGALAWRS